MAEHLLMDGKLRVFKRDESPFWQCATFMGGKFRRKSTKEETLAQAKDFAEGWYLDLRGKSRVGELPGGKTFKKAADQFLREYDIITEGHRNRVYVEGHHTRLRLHLLPFFGTKTLSEITPGLVQEYRIHRREKGVAPRGKPRADNTTNQQKIVAKPVKVPARNTMHQEMVTLRQVLKTALRHQWMQYLPDLSEPYKIGGKIDHRAWFSAEEYKKLYEATRKRAQKPRRKNHKWACEQVHDYVLFMANTGLRPDEAARLQFRDVTIVDDDASGQTILEIEMRGKRGVGYCKSTEKAVLPFQRLKARQRLAPTPDDPTKMALPRPNDPIFPKKHRELINAILEEEELKHDREGRPRTAYSLRHTYICFRLMEGADIYQIAKNCHTSVEMIEKYYAAHIKTSLDASAINRMRPRKKKKTPKDSTQSTDIAENP
jgi:integrase